MRTQNTRWWTYHNPQVWPPGQRVADAWCSLHGGVGHLQIQTAFMWTIADNMFGECHDTYTQKTYFQISEKGRQGELWLRKQSNVFVLTLYSFPVAVARRFLYCTIQPLFLYSFRYCWICSRPDLACNICRLPISNANIQLICQSTNPFGLHFW